ncbi:hypothetical protein MKK65_08990, partial [Methylobacterium sp. J-001]|uniref:hypothetical protein n=1 Tax=Methylobacterium sp. J-001 TaxID=2836609 RepID=UPI001FB9297A
PSAPRSAAASAPPAPRSSFDLAACPTPSVLADPLNQSGPKPAGQVTSAHVERSIARGFVSRDDLSDMLARIVSVFDGVMRVCNSEAVRMNQQGSPYEANPVRSFQSLETARNKMMPHWDMAVAANDWTAFKLAFQKRHCFAHTLGVVDQSYIDKSGDSSAILGRNVRLSPEEVRECARNAVSIVDRFFGQYFS